MAFRTGDVEAALRTLLLVPSSSPEHIAEVCRTVESSLQCLHSPSQARNFFASFLPILLQKIFGFQEQESAVPSSSPPAESSKPSPPSPSPPEGWLSAVSSSPDDVGGRALISLLSPSGIFFTYLLRLDKQSSSLRFFFPTERLPVWVQDALKDRSSYSYFRKHAQSLLHVPTLFADRIVAVAGGVPQVQLETFEYFFFWFAYYAVCRREAAAAAAKEQANKENADVKRPKKPFPSWVTGFQHRRPSLPNWASTHHPIQQSNMKFQEPYLQLLQLFLAHFVPVVASPRVSPSSVQSPRSAIIRLSSRSEFLVQTFVEFWLVNQGSAGGGGFVPPSLQLTDAVRVLINHINKVSSTFSGWSASCSFSKFIQRPLYWFICRPFQTWTATLPVEKAWKIIDVWLDFLQPWVVDGPSELNSEFVVQSHTFSERWQGFVIENYLFYTNLTVYFLEFVLKNMHCNLETMLQMVSKVLHILAGSDDLLDYLKSLSGFANNNEAEKVKTSNVKAAICDQLQTLEDINCNWKDGSCWPLLSTHVRLFSKDAGGGEAILELLIRQAEGELPIVPHALHMNCKKSLEAIKKAGMTIFSSKMEQASPIALPVAPVRHISQSFKAITALPQHTWKDVKYKGDWMRRPVESTEFAWLVRLLVQLSDAINQKLTLNSELDVPELELIDQENSSEARNNLVSFTQDVPELTLDFNFSKVVGLVLWCLSTALSKLGCFVRGRGWRLNLRFLAKKPVAIVAMIFVVYVLRKLSFCIVSVQ